MKKRIIRFLLCLLLGVVTTVGVAWGLGWSHSPRSMRVDLASGGEGLTLTSFHPNGLGHRGVRVSVSRAFGCELVYITRGEILEPRFAESEYELLRQDFKRLDLAAAVREYNQGPDGSARDVVPWWCERLVRFDEVPSKGRINPQFYGYGLPLTTFYWVGVTGNESDGVYWWTSESGEVNAIPLRPILPGFIINTFFYAAIWFVLFFAIGFTKRTIRKKRGRCVKCGYDLRGHQPHDPHPQPLSSPQASRRGDRGERGVHGGCPECGWNRG